MLGFSEALVIAIIYVLVIVSTRLKNLSGSLALGQGLKFR